jgi:hypothetical protein
VNAIVPYDVGEAAERVVIGVHMVEAAGQDGDGAVVPQAADQRVLSSAAEGKEPMRRSCIGLPTLVKIAIPAAMLFLSRYIQKTGLTAFGC